MEAGKMSWALMRNPRGLESLGFRCKRLFCFFLCCFVLICFVFVPFAICLLLFCSHICQKENFLFLFLVFEPFQTNFDTGMRHNVVCVGLDLSGASAKKPRNVTSSFHMLGRLGLEHVGCGRFFGYLFFNCSRYEGS